VPNIKKGLNSFQLKIIALVFMTIDHIAHYIFVPLQAPNAAVEIFKGAGRIAAPLFLFVVVNSAYYTRSKLKFVLRLYIAGAVMSLLNALFSEVSPAGFFIKANIFPTLMYTVMYIYLVESIVNSLRNKRYIRSACFTGGLLFTYLPIALSQWAEQGILTTFPVLKENLSLVFTIQKIIRAIAPSVFAVDYSVIFVLLGIAWYFVRNRKIQCGILLLISAFLFCVTNNLFSIPVGAYSLMMELFLGKQWLMVLVLPFIYIFNKEKGKNAKWLFYLYYPAHQYILLMIALLLAS
jgi:hypothetical protein